VISPNKSRASEPACTCGVADKPGVLGEELIFDAGKLHSQLADLLQLYLSRASDPDAVQQCSAKDAISCAKALTAMMSDVQSGKPASVDKATTWPRLESPSVGRGLVRPGAFTPAAFSTHRRPAAINGRPTGRPLTPSPQSPISILDDALSAVLASDQESHLEEPYQRFLARMDRLCDEVCDRLDAAESEDSCSLACDRRLKTDGCVAAPT